MNGNPLDGIRVLELATGIAGPYCGKLLADAGADVVKCEPPAGDPLRRWRSSAPDTELPTDGALFKFINTSKRSVVGTDSALPDLAAAADLIIVDEGTDATRLAELQAWAPQAVITSITPFGRTGPAATDGHPATEFTLQAISGSTAGRGLKTASPLYAGGRIGEWMAGVYAAAVGLATLRGSQRFGRGDLVDISMLECMVSTLGGLAAVIAIVFPGGSDRSGRSIELPSIEPTADGLVGFCTITGQQFQDFLVMIDHAELLDDTDLATFGGRQARREEFLTMVHEWTTQRTTDEIIELAALMRIPVAPIGSPETIAKIDQFVERGVFVPHPDGTFLQPRPPYRIDEFRGAERRAAPSIGQDAGTIEWTPRSRATVADPAPEGTLPLAGLRVLDFTAFWAGPHAAALLASLGADVIKVEGVSRPDGMRFASGKTPGAEEWWEWGTVFLSSNLNKRAITLELGDPRAQEIAKQLLEQCDVVIENFSPRVMGNLGLTWEVIHERNPNAIMVRMPAFGLDGPWRDRTGFAQTMEQASGMAWLTGEADGPPVIPRGPCDPLSGLHAVFALLVAVVQRERTGVGSLIESTMVEAALNIAADIVIEHSESGTELMRDGNRGPVAVPQGLYRCAGDDSWLALAVADEAQWQALCQVIDRPDWLRDDDLSSRAGRRKRHDELDAGIEAVTQQRDAEELALALRAAGVPAERLIPAAEIPQHPQLVARGYYREVAHPVVGPVKMPTVPFALASYSGSFARSAAPVYGQHNREVLAELLGLGAADLEGLEAEGIIAYRPAGL